MKLERQIVANMLHCAIVTHFSRDLPDSQFFDDALGAPAQIAVRRKQEFMPNPIDLLALNAIYCGGDDLHCFEIVQRIYQLTKARVSVSHKQTWLALRRLLKADWVEEVKRDPDAGRRRSPRYRLKHGGGSHLKSANNQWRRIAPVVTAIAELH